MAGKADKKHDRPVATVVETKKRSVIGKRQVVGLLLLVVVVAAICGVAYWRYGSKADKQADAPQAHQTTLATAKSAEDKGDYSAEAQAYQDYLNTKPDDQYAKTTLIRMAVAYQNAQNYDKAIATYQDALDKYGNNDGEVKYAATRGLGLAYEKRGDANKSKDDYQKALGYFQQAYKLSSADPLKGSVAGSDDSQIRYLQERLQ